MTGLLLSKILTTHPGFADTGTHSSSQRLRTTSRVKSLTWRASASRDGSRPNQFSHDQSSRPSGSPFAVSCAVGIGAGVGADAGASELVSGQSSELASATRCWAGQQGEPAHQPIPCLTRLFLSAASAASRRSTSSSVSVGSSPSRTACTQRRAPHRRCCRNRSREWNSVRHIGHCEPRPSFSFCPCH